MGAQCCVAEDSQGEDWAWAQNGGSGRHGRRDAMGRLWDRDAFSRADSTKWAPTSSHAVATRERRRGVSSSSASGGSSRRRDNTGVDSFFDRYALGAYLGRGATAEVRVATEYVTGDCFACKIVEKGALRLQGPRAVAGLAQELKLLTKLHHPNIISLEAVYETARCYMVVTELATTDLFEYLVRRPGGTLSEYEASAIVRAAANGVFYMHSNGIIHRDLKLENIMICEDERTGGRELKIIDFGLSTIIRSPTCQTFLGTFGYIAPEILRNCPYGKPVDMWALGVIVYILVAGEFPFAKTNARASYDDMCKAFAGSAGVPALSFPSGISEACRETILALLTLDPDERMTAEQAMADPWIMGISCSAALLDSPAKLIRRGRRADAKFKQAASKNNQENRPPNRDPVTGQAPGHEAASEAPATQRRRINRRLRLSSSSQ